MDLPNCCIRMLLRITLRGGNDLDILAARDAVRGVRLLTFAAQYSNDPTKTALSSAKGCSCAIARRRISGSSPEALGTCRYDVRPRKEPAGTGAPRASRV